MKDDETPRELGDSTKMPVSGADAGDGGMGLNPGLMSGGMEGVPNWEDLKIFHTVCQFGSFSKAADALALTQPTISRRIDGLEKILSTQLLRRSPAGVAPTDQGRLVLEHAQQMQLSARELTRKVRQSDDSVEGLVRIAVPDGLLTYWLTPRLQEFQRAYPMLSLEFVSGDDDVELDGSATHLSIRYDDDVPPHFVTLPLGATHHVAYASKEYLGVFGMPKTVQDLVTHRYVYHTNQRHQKERWDKEILALMEITKVCFITNTTSAMVEAIRNGMGIGMLPSYFATFEKELVLLDVDYRAYAHFWLIYERRQRDLARVRAVIDWIKSCIDKRRMPWFSDTFVHPDEFGLYGGKDEAPRV